VMYGYGFNMGWGGGLLLILFWGIVIVLAIWVLRWLFSSSQPRQPDPAPSAEDIAKTRYARGEVSREDYLALIADMENQER
jgi:putative membrane protein